MEVGFIEQAAYVDADADSLFWVVEKHRALGSKWTAQCPRHMEGNMVYVILCLIS